MGNVLTSSEDGQVTAWKKLALLVFAYATEAWDSVGSTPGNSYRGIAENGSMTDIMEYETYWKKDQHNWARVEDEPYSTSQMETW